MKVEYAEHALSDLVSIAAYYASIDNPAAGATVAASIRDVVARVASAPASGRPVAQRPGVRVAVNRR